MLLQVASLKDSIWNAGRWWYTHTHYAGQTLVSPSSVLHLECLLWNVIGGKVLVSMSTELSVRNWRCWVQKKRGLNRMQSTLCRYLPPAWVVENSNSGHLLSTYTLRLHTFYCWPGLWHCLHPIETQAQRECLFVNSGFLISEPSSDPLYFPANVANTRTITKRMGSITPPT